MYVNWMPLLEPDHPMTKKMDEYIAGIDQESNQNLAVFVREESLRYELGLDEDPVKTAALRIILLHLRLREQMLMFSDLEQRAINEARERLNTPV